MKKIMFSDKFGLTQAVLSGKKTMTRRIIVCPSTHKGEHVSGFNIIRNKAGEITRLPELLDDDERWFDDGAFIKPKYTVGEIIAVAQSYKDCGYSEIQSFDGIPLSLIDTKGWTNKMFVRADLMPSRIRITDVIVERLQDISDDDCLKEGIQKFRRNCGMGNAMSHYEYGWIDENGNDVTFHNIKEAFSILINKISGYGIWERNPYVFAYEFELIR